MSTKKDKKMAERQSLGVIARVFQVISGDTSITAEGMSMVFCLKMTLFERMFEHEVAAEI
jgi:hypothetical protein